MYMRNACKKILVMAVILAGLVSFVHQTNAQTTTPIFGFNKIWKYDRSGVDLGTAWRTNTFNDNAWQSGAGLLGYDSDSVAAYTAIAPSGFGVTFPNPLSQTVTTYYFRTTFSLPGGLTPTTPGLVLVASNLVDDGCLIWLNGRLAGSIRVPQNATFATPATGGPAPEGTNEVLFLPVNLLQSGVNTLAVEVHQPAAASSDVVWGMRLNAIAPTALAITNQPDSQVVEAGASVSFNVGVSGGPVFYRWQKDGVNVSATATNSTYSIPNVQLTHAGAYRVIVSNAVNVLTSEVAQLTVIEDTTGPKMVSAIIDDGNGSNKVSIRFDETLISTVPPTAKNSAQNPANYRLVSTSNPGFAYSITNVRRSGVQILLEIGDLNWDPLGSYYLTVNNVADRFGNQINPNSVIGVGVQIFTNLTRMSDVWNYYDCADVEFCDPNADAVYANEAFAKTNFVVDPLYWGAGNGIFVKESGLGEIAPCTGDTRGSVISFQIYPTLFRRTFMLPPNASSNGTLRMRFIFDDGMLIYLNGQPLLSSNVLGPITRDSRSLPSTFVGNAICYSNDVRMAVTTLRPGTNWLAAAVVQNAANHEADTVFGFEMDLVTVQTAPAPTNRPPGIPTLVRARQTNPNQFVLSWPPTNYGYALMYSTAIAGTGARPDRNWFTNEANWIQVKDQSNPYTNSIPPTNNPARFYKLFREKLND